MSEEVYRPIGECTDEIESDDNGVESLCPNCEKNGVTKILLTKIPYFRDIILMAFECPHCGFKNSEVQSGTEISEKGCLYTLRDLNRQIIKSNSGVVRIPELEFEIPSITQQGVLSTIEGIIMSARDAILMGQEERRKIDPTVTAQIDLFIQKLSKLITPEGMPFHFILDDPAGQSFIENPFAPHSDPRLEMNLYYRTKEQQIALGIALPDDIANEEEEEENKEENKEDKEKDNKDENVSDYDSLKIKEEKISFESSSTNTEKEVMEFETNCYACSKKGLTKMCVTDIPNFKEIIIMSFQCDHCGYKCNEIKGGGAIPSEGEIITLKVTKETSSEDLVRDFIKSDSAEISIPELDFSMEPGTMGGMYTSVEGVLAVMIDRIGMGLNYYFDGDSAAKERKEAYEKFINELKLCKDGKRDFTLIVKDPLANSWIFSPNEPDERLKQEKYTRSEEENEELGLLDMKTENYSSDLQTINEGDKEEDEEKEENES